MQNERIATNAKRRERLLHDECQKREFLTPFFSSSKIRLIILPHCIRPCRTVEEKRKKKRKSDDNGTRDFPSPPILFPCAFFSFLFVIFYLVFSPLSSSSSSSSSSSPSSIHSFIHPFLSLGTSFRIIYGVHRRRCRFTFSHTKPFCLC
jgi:hypothetical protein